MIELNYRQLLDEYIISQFRGKAGIKETLDAIADQYSKIQNDCKKLLSWTSIDTAEGDLLDYIGFLFGITRDYFDISQYFCLNRDDVNRSKYFFFRESATGNVGNNGSLSDLNFRSRIKAKIGLKFSNHTRNENIQIIKNMTFADDVHITALNDFEYTTTNKLITVPQNINLELSSGTLTLKAGSKVYVPNGFEQDGTTPKFDVFIVEADRTSTRTTNRQEVYICRGITGGSFNQWTYVFSGSTAPTGQTYMLWYDTANNKVKITTNSGSTWTDGYSLPVCLATSDSTQIISIDQVFGWCGYIGNSVFVYPKVRGLIPDGFFSNESIRNIEKQTENVITRTFSSASDTHAYTFFVDESTSMSKRDDAWSYDQDENKNYVDGNVYKAGFKVFDITASNNGKITSITPNDVESSYHTGNRMMLNIDLIGDTSKMFITDKTLAEIEGVLGYGVGLNALTINGV